MADARIDSVPGDLSPARELGLPHKGNCKKRTIAASHPKNVTGAS